VNAVSSFSFLTHFTAISAGVIDLRDLIFFLSLIVLFLAANVVVVDLKKTG
jgi:ABC-2 type transport system permease protein